jgi:hypothetical protein
MVKWLNTIISAPRCPAQQGQRDYGKELLNHIPINQKNESTVKSSWPSCMQRRQGEKALPPVGLEKVKNSAFGRCLLA